MGCSSDRVISGLINERDLCKIREAVCIQVDKIYDSCSEKDCIEDAIVKFCHDDKVQALLKKAQSVKIRNVEIADVSADVEPVPFKRGFYTIEIRYYIKVLLEVLAPRPTGGLRIYLLPGLITFCKKVMLFGSEGNVKIFKSYPVCAGVGKSNGSKLEQDNLPFAKIEVADPIALCAKIFEKREWPFCCFEIPKHLVEAIEEAPEYADLDFRTDDDDDDDDRKHCKIHYGVMVTVGIFSIVKLVRLAQLLIPAFDFCYPHKSCIASTEDDPCELFETIEFPLEEFFPPQKFDFPGAMDDDRSLKQGMDG